MSTDNDRKLRDELSQSQRRGRGRPRKYTDEQRKERAKKAYQAGQLAMSVLRERHRTEYEELLDKAKTEVGYDT